MIGPQLQRIAHFVKEFVAVIDTANVRFDAYLSFAGVLTFPSAATSAEAVEVCPFDRLLVETDAPYLAPVPHRGRPNRPGLVPVVGARIAEIKDLTPPAMAEATWGNAELVYGL